MRIMSYNILYGGIDEHGSRIPSIKKALMQEHCDVYCLQETNCFQENDRNTLDEFQRAAGVS